MNAGRRKRQKDNRASSGGWSGLAVRDAWRTSSHSAGGNCAEVGQDATGVLVRDTTDRGGPVLAFTPAAWAAFLAGKAVDA